MVMREQLIGFIRSQWNLWRQFENDPILYVSQTPVALLAHKFEESDTAWMGDLCHVLGTWTDQYWFGVLTEALSGLAAADIAIIASPLRHALMEWCISHQAITLPQVSQARSGWKWGVISGTILTSIVGAGLLLWRKKKRIL